MAPEITLFGLTVSSYSLMAVLAAAAFIALSWRPLRRCGLPAAGVVLLMLAVCVAFLVGARLWNVAVNPDSYHEGRPWYVLRMTGFSVYGGVAAVLIVFLLASAVARVRPGRVLDAVTVPAAVSFSVSRVGCFLNGCCSGRETDLPWGVVFPFETEGLSASLSQARAVHPTQLYELILALLGIPLCLFIVKRLRPGAGGLFLLYGAWANVMRLLVLPLRALPYSSLVSNIIYPLLYYVLTVACVFLFVWSCRRGREETS